MNRIQVLIRENGIFPCHLHKSNIDRKTSHSSYHDRNILKLTTFSWTRWHFVIGFDKSIKCCSSLCFCASKLSRKWCMCFFVVRLSARRPTHLDELISKAPHFGQPKYAEAFAKHGLINFKLMLSQISSRQTHRTNWMLVRLGVIQN